MNMDEPKRRRRRPTVSCTQCRARKVKCNREMPCGNCVAFHKDVCVYEGFPPLSRRLPDTARPHDVPRPSQAPLSQKLPPSLSAVSSPAKQSPEEDIPSLRSKIKQLEDELSDVNARLASRSVPTPAGSNAEFSSSLLGSGVEIQDETCIHGQVQEIGRGLMHKTRLFGQSHWMNSVAPVWDLVNSLEPYMREGRSTATASMQRCKTLARTIKARREPVWPAVAKARLPERSVADKLVACYLRTIETVYRVVHIPTFRRSYEAMWSTQNQPDAAASGQVKLAMAIGAMVHDGDLGLRDLAVQWIYEAQTWLSRPGFFKAHLNLQTLQTEILLLLAREIVGVDRSSTWVSVGTLLRKVVQMGLHREPARLLKGGSSSSSSSGLGFAVEMRRRLFNTVLELALQASILSGGPPFVYLDEFDVGHPGNFDDEQLMAEDPSPQPDSCFTQSTMTRLLAHTFPQRLAIAKFLNDTGSRCSYDEVLRLDAELRASYRTARKIFLPATAGGTSKPAMTTFAGTFVDVLINHYLISLHTPFHSASLSSAAHAFSRKVMVDASLRIWRGLLPHPPAQTKPRRPEDDDGRSDLATLAMSPWYLLHTLLRQASLAISTELRAQLRENEDEGENSLGFALGLAGPVPLRADLLAVMEQAKAWFLRCVERWNTNVKGYVLMRIVAAPVEAYMKRGGVGGGGRVQGDLAKYLALTVVEALAECLGVLETTVAALGEREQAKVDGVDGDGGHETTSAEYDVGLAMEMADDWDLMMANAYFDSGSAEPIDWLFDETVWRV